MEKDWKKISPEEITDNVFKLMDKDWTLITAGKINSFNMMTASWAGLGVLWKKNVAFCFIRPQRYTFEFAEKNDYFTLSFFEEEYRETLNICGTQSGKTINKVEKTGLITLETEIGNIYYKQSRMFFECRKLYADFIKPENFIANEIPQKIYPTNDFHKMYIGEIVNCFYRS